MVSNMHREEIIRDFYEGRPKNENDEEIFTKEDMKNFPNDDIDPTKIARSSKKEIWWECQDPLPHKICSHGCRHIWKGTISGRAGGSRFRGCPLCSDNSEKVCQHNSLGGLYPNLMDEWDFDKNDVDPYSIKPNYRHKVHWKCTTSECGCIHEWKATPNHRVSSGKGTGCPGCSRPRKLHCCNTLDNDDSGLFDLWDDVSDKSDIPIKSTTPYAWRCPKTCPHGCEHTWKRSPYNIMEKGNNDCPYCEETTTRKRRYCKHTNLIATHPHIMGSFDHEGNTKNGIMVDITKISRGSDHKYKWKCNNGHSYDCSVANRVAGKGCRECKHKTETMVRDELKEYNVDRKAFSADWCKHERLLPFDILLPDYKIIVEIDGPQHFVQVSNWRDPKEELYNDSFKTMKAFINGYSVLRIRQDYIYANQNSQIWKNRLHKKIQRIINRKNKTIPIVTMESFGKKKIYKNHVDLINKFLDMDIEEQKRCEYDYEGFIDENNEGELESKE